MMNQNISGLRATSFNRARCVAVAAGLGLSCSVMAQTDATGAADPSELVTEVVVTSSRVVRDGYEAPTPTTVLGQEQIQAAAPVNIADYVNQLPQLSGSQTPRVGTVGTGGGVAGSNFLNLRGLGANRTLVLLDRRRVVGSTLTGSVDVNILPSSLVSRVDVVTGGASAAWGSDAVAGVVNFVLDTKYTGFKADVQGGVTDRNDGENGKIELTYGQGFAGDRGHILLSGTYSETAGIDRTDSREWYQGWKTIANPAFAPGNGQPARIVRPHVNLSQAAPGGLISAGPLAGIQFGPGGIPMPFEFGEVSGPFMVGGENVDLGGLVSLDVPLRQRNLFGRASFDITSNITAYAEYLSGKAVANQVGSSQWRFNNVPIAVDNAYLDAGIRAQMEALNLTTLNIGTTNRAIGLLQPTNDRQVERFVAGLDGTFGDGWTWRAYFQHGDSRILNLVPNDIIMARYTLAVDAVRNPATGGIVCRSTLADPANGCVPLNLFGADSASPQAIAWVTGVSTLDQTVKQDVYSVDASGELGATWAGPISLAVGIEHRREQVSGTADPLSLTNSYFAGNFKPTRGKYDVTEGFAETVVPLARDLAFAESIDLNAAVRRTKYSTAGSVTTWKIGGTWDLNDAVRFRATRSRDIRAPNLNDLFLAGQVFTQTVNDPTRNNQTFTITRVVGGNTGLSSEIADTVNFGVVYTPRFLSGLTASVDYYDIEINGAIATLSNQQIADQCFQGNTALCDLIVRNGSGVITQITALPINFATEVVKGADVELSYRTNLADLAAGLGGTVTFRGLATYIDSHYTVNAGIRDEQAGEVGQPRWRYYGTIDYQRDPIGATLIIRHTPSVQYDVAWGPLDVDDNTVDSSTTFDLALRYGFESLGSESEIYAKIDNIFDTDPPVVAGGGNLAFLSQGVSPGNYDVIGRSYRIGVRFRY